MVVDTGPSSPYILKLGWGSTVISSTALRLPAQRNDKNLDAPL